MNELPDYIHLRVIHYLQFSHVWSISLVNKRYHTLLHTKGTCDELYQQRWNNTRTGTTFHDYLEKARTSTINIISVGSQLSCNRWKLEKDGNDSGSHATTPLPENTKKVAYDDFDEEILPETDDFGDEIREEGKSAFEEEDFVAHNKGKRDGFWITFEANSTDKFGVEFLEDFIDCRPVIAVLVGATSVRIIHNEYCVKEALQGENSKARLNASGFQKYWALITQQTIRFGRGELGEDCVIEWKGPKRVPTHAGIYAEKPILIRYFGTSGCNYLDYGLDDSAAEIALACQQMIMEVLSSNWEFPHSSPATILYTVYYENSIAFGITCELGSQKPISVHVTPSQIQIIMLIQATNNWSMDGEKNARFPRMQGSRFGHYWATFQSKEVYVGVGRQAGTSQIGKLSFSNDVSPVEYKNGRVKLSCFRISGHMLCKISNMRVTWE